VNSIARARFFAMLLEKLAAQDRLCMLKRHIAFYGEAPRQTAADGGFASGHNLGEAKALALLKHRLFSRH